MDPIQEEAIYRQFQRALSERAIVEARWTELLIPQRARAWVRKRNRKSVRVELIESAGKREAGMLLTLPLKNSDRDTAWTRERGVFPLTA